MSPEEMKDLATLKDRVVDASKAWVISNQSPMSCSRLCGAVIDVVRLENHIENHLEKKGTTPNV